MLIVTDSAEQTFNEGRLLAKTLKAPTVIALFGDLGCGKTTFSKGLIAELTKTDPDLITSPTFSYLHIYEGPLTVYHFDLYRLKSENEFYQRGFEEFMLSDGICCIEWAERISTVLPINTMRISLKHLGEERRSITVEL